MGTTEDAQGQDNCKTHCGSSDSNFCREGSGALHSLGESNPGGLTAVETIILINPGAPLGVEMVQVLKDDLFTPSRSCPGSPRLALGF